MNRTVKIILITAAILAPAGVIIALLGIYFGGRSGWSMQVKDGKSVVSAGIIDETVELDAFEGLDLEVSSADVNIMRGDSYAIQYKTRDNEVPEITQEGGTLKVRQPSGGFVMFDFGFTEDVNNYTIMIPEGDAPLDLTAKSSSGDIMLDRISVSGTVRASSGDILLNDIAGDTLEIATSSGEIEGDKVKYSSIGFEASSGDISMLRLFSDDVNCKTSSGDIELYDSEAKNIKGSASSGEITLELNGNAGDYSYRIETTSGDIKVNGREYEKDYASESGKDGRIDLSATSGDVEVTVR